MVPHFLFIPTQEGVEKINIAQLLYIRICKGGTELVMTDRSIHTVAGIAQLEKSLAREQFVRVHAGYLVALDQIISFERYQVELPGAMIPVERKYWTRLTGKVRIITAPQDFPYSLCVNRQGKLRINLD